MHLKHTGQFHTQYTLGSKVHSITLNPVHQWRHFESLRQNSHVRLCPSHVNRNSMQRFMPIPKHGMGIPKAWDGHIKTFPFRLCSTPFLSFCCHSIAFAFHSISVSLRLRPIVQLFVAFVFNRTSIRLCKAINNHTCT